MVRSPRVCLKIGSLLGSLVAWFVRWLVPFATNDRPAQNGKRRTPIRRRRLFGCRLVRGRLFCCRTKWCDHCRPLSQRKDQRHSPFSNNVDCLLGRALSHRLWKTLTWSVKSPPKSRFLQLVQLLLLLLLLQLLVKPKRITTTTLIATRTARTAAPPVILP